MVVLNDDFEKQYSKFISNYSNIDLVNELRATEQFIDILIALKLDNYILFDELMTIIDILKNEIVSKYCDIVFIEEEKQ